MAAACAARRRAPAWRRRGRPSSSPRIRTTRAHSRSGRPTPERLGGLPGALDGAAAAHLAPLGARPLGSGKAARPRRRRPGHRRCCNAAAAPHSTVSTCFQRGLLGHVQVNTTLWGAPHWEAGKWGAGSGAPCCAASCVCARAAAAESAGIFSRGTSNRPGLCMGGVARALLTSISPAVRRRCTKRCCGSRGRDSRVRSKLRRIMVLILPHHLRLG